jgi:hypothetical protein
VIELATSLVCARISPILALAIYRRRWVIELATSLVCARISPILALAIYRRRC